MHKNYFLIISILVTITFSCTSNVQINEQIQSKWIVDKAMRNGRLTSTMENGFFKFWHLDSLETNILGEKIKAHYHLDKNIIICSSELPQFTVDKAGADTLVLKTKISEYHFSFTLIKSHKK